MGAAWDAIAALATAAAAAGSCAGVLWHGGRREGRVDTVLEQLTAIIADHETRLRNIEQLPGCHHRSR